MISEIYYSFGLLMAFVALVFGLYEFSLPRWRARLSIWRLGYRIIMAVMRKPAKPVAKWRVRWARLRGGFWILLSAVWFVSLHPQLRLLSQDLYDPDVHRWQVDKGDGLRWPPLSRQILGQVKVDC